jgi:hypothetical protein
MSQHPPEINTTNYPFLDPAYVHFLDINEPGPPRWKRTTEVKYISNLNSGSTNSHHLYKGRPLEKMVWRRPGQISAGTPLFRCPWGAGLGFSVWAVQFGTSKVEMWLTQNYQCWNGTFFKHTTLKEIGLCVQLGHWVGEQCSNPKPAAGNNFVVIDTNSVHKIRLNYYDYEFAQHTTTQLLRTRWYPDTPTAPNTAATFNVLEYFHLLTFESKASVFEFLHASMRRTNNIDISAVPVSSSS